MNWISLTDLCRPKAFVPRSQFDRLFRALDKFDQQQLRIRALRYEDFLWTPYWFCVSTRVKECQGYKCFRCDQKPRQGFDVHHLTYENHGAEHNFMSDFVGLCRNCHKAQHDWPVFKHERLLALRSSKALPPSKRFCKRMT